MSKVYAIKRGRIVGKVYSWDECLQATKGYPSAEYKSFKSDVEADAYLRGEEVVKAIDNKGNKVEIKKPVSEDVVNLFCDGGYKDDMYSFGTYLECANKDYLACGMFDTNSVAYQTGARNIIGECVGCLSGLELLASLGYKRVNIYHDYEGLSKWVTGEYKAKSEIALRYKSTFEAIVRQYGIQYRFFYVNGHKGIRGNEIADKLSTRARKQKLSIDSNLVWRLQYDKSNALFQNPLLFL